MPSIGDVINGNVANDKFAKRLARIAAQLEAEGIVPEPIIVHCEVCQDRGLVSLNAPYGDPRFGKLFPCEFCEAGQRIYEAQWASRIKHSGLLAAYQHLTFASWDAMPEEAKAQKGLARAAAGLFINSERHIVSIREAYRLCGRPWKYEDVQVNSLVFQGPFGTGKTGLAAAIVNELVARMEPVLYIRLQDFIASVQERYGKDEPPSADDVIDTARRAPVLVLDEFNMTSSTSDRREIVENIIRYRHNHVLPTVITCNFTQQELTDQWGERTTSVLFAMVHWIPMGGYALRDVRPPLEVF